MHTPLRSQQPGHEAALHCRTHRWSSHPKPGSHVAQVVDRGPQAWFEVPDAQNPSSVQQPPQFALEQPGRTSTDWHTPNTHFARFPQLVHALPLPPQAKSAFPWLQSPLASQQPAHVAGLHRGGGVTMPPSPQRTKAQYQGPVVAGRDGGGFDAPPQPPQLANTMMTSAESVPRPMVCKRVPCPVVRLMVKVAARTSGSGARSPCGAVGVARAVCCGFCAVLQRAEWLAATSRRRAARCRSARRETSASRSRVPFGNDAPRRGAHALDWNIGVPRVFRSATTHLLVAARARRGASSSRGLFGNDAPPRRCARPRREHRRHRCVCCFWPRRTFPSWNIGVCVACVVWVASHVPVVEHRGLRRVCCVCRVARSRRRTSGSASCCSRLQRGVNGGAARRVFCHAVALVAHWRAMEAPCVPLAC